MIGFLLHIRDRKVYDHPMNAEDTLAAGSVQAAAPAPTPPGAETVTPASSSPAAGVGANGHKPRIHIGKPVGVVNNGKTQPAKPAPSQIIDESLDEDDLQITLTAEVHGRKLAIGHCRCTATVYDGIRSRNRGTFFQTMERLLGELKQGFAVKANRALPQDPAPQDAKPNSNGEKRPLITTPIPRFEGFEDEECPDYLKIHVPRPLDAQ